MKVHDRVNEDFAVLNCVDDTIRENARLHASEIRLEVTLFFGIVSNDLDCTLNFFNEPIT